jgi:hypothetical protein
MKCKNVEWIQLAMDIDRGVARCFKLSNEPTVSTKFRQFPDQMSDWKLLKEDYLYGINL